MAVRPPLLLLLAAAALGLAPSSAAAAAFPEGVAAGDATTTSARLWTRPQRPGRLVALVSRRDDMGSPVARITGRARPASKNAVTLVVRGLAPGRRYFFQFRRGEAKSPVGRFTTAPSTRSTAAVHFAVTAGLDPPSDPQLGVLGTMAKERNEFNVLLGDTAPASAPGLGDKRAAYDQVLAVAAARAFRRGAGQYATWGAGEFGPNFAPAGKSGRARYAAGARAFLEATPTVTRAGTGLYRSIRWGRNLELFLLDERSFRSPLANGPACVNPSTGVPDPAPTLPNASRAEYSGFFGPLGAAVAEACLEQIRDPRRTMLGAAQFRALRHDLAASTARFKVILSEEPLSQFYFLPYSRWEGYESERQRLIEFIRDNVSDAVVLSAGVGAGVVGPVRLQTLEPEGVAGGGFFDVGLGTASGPTFTDRLEREAGAGFGDPVTRLFLHRAPPYGAGMRCSATATYAYAQVTVRGRRLTVRLTGADGKAALDADGTRCPAYVLESDTFSVGP
jgi:alkaline phosphatase D